MNPGVQYYPVIARIATTERGMEFRTAIIGSIEPLKSESFPLLRALDRFIFKYDGPRFGIEFDDDGPLPGKAWRQAERWIFSKLEKKGISADRVGSSIIAITIDLRAVQITALN